MQQWVLLLLPPFLTYCCWNPQQQTYTQQLVCMFFVLILPGVHLPAVCCCAGLLSEKRRGTRCYLRKRHGTSNGIPHLSLSPPLSTLSVGRVSRSSPFGPFGRYSVSFFPPLFSFSNTQTLRRVVAGCSGGRPLRGRLALLRIVLVLLWRGENKRISNPSPVLFCTSVMFYPPAEENFLLDLEPETCGQPLEALLVRSTGCLQYPG